MQSNAMQGHSTKIHVSTFQELPNQAMLLKVKEMTWPEFKEKITDNPKAYEEIKKCQGRYYHIQKVWPAIGNPHEGWSEIFVEGLSLLLDGINEQFHTSIVTKIDPYTKTFKTLNSIYTYKVFEPDEDECIPIYVEIEEDKNNLKS